MSDATKVRVEVQRGGAGGLGWPGAMAVLGKSWSAQVLTDGGVTHRLFRHLTRGQSGALGTREEGCDRGATEPRRTRPGNQALPHGELVSE